MGEYSALAEQFLRKKDKPIYSVGQGLVEAGSDIAEAFLMKNAEKKDRARDELSNRALAKAYQDASNTDLGIYPEFAGQSPKMDANQRGRYAASQLAEADPKAAAAMTPSLMQMAQQYQAPKDTYEVTKEFGVMRRPAGGGAPEVVMPVPTPARASQLLTPDEEAQKIRLAKAGLTPKEPGTPSSKFAFDRTLNKNRSVTSAEEVAEPDRFAPPVSSPMIKLFNQAGQEIGTGDPNDPDIQKRIQAGEVRTAPPRQFSGEQSKAAGFANDAITSEANVERLMSPVAEPGQPAPKPFDPTGNDGWAMSNYTASPEYQQYQQAKSNWGMAVLRQESGGAITPDEGLAYAETFFPKFGDDPETVKQKKDQRAQKVRGVVAASGGAYDANFGSKPSDAAQTAARGASGSWGDGGTKVIAGARVTRLD